MKKACLVLTVLFACLNSLTIAQPTLYGLTPFGGKGSGTIVKYDIATKSLSADYSFPVGDGRPPIFEFAEAPNGKFYNVVRDGGAAGLGNVISYDPVTKVVSVAAEFTNAIGVSPDGALTLGSNGKFYGMTVGGGTNQYGLIYSFDPETNILEKVMDFYGTEVRSPFFSLLRTKDGKLYGVGPAVNGGNYIVFTFDVATNAITRIPFTDNNPGYNANGNLAEGADGKLYIVTGSGSNGYGALYSYMPGSFGFDKILDLDARIGDYPLTYLIGASNGIIYGTSNMGGANYSGCIFSFDPSLQTINYLHDFGLPGGTYPRGGMVETGNGQLIGSALGGINGAGIIYKLDIASNQVVTAINFNGTNGAIPNLGLLNSSGNKVYGTTNEGGKSNIGVIYSFEPVTNSISTEFQYLNTTGLYPMGSLFQDENNKLYGIASVGGISGGKGVVFSYDPVTKVQSSLAEFDGANGSNPYGHLVKAANKNYYGTTLDGGLNNLGVIYSFDPANNKLVKLHDFNGLNGSKPFGSLIVAGNGNLYGMTSEGGVYNKGVVFSFNPISNSFTKIFDFDGSNGANPYGGFVEVNGKLFGMTQQGGTAYNYGVIISVDLSSNTVVKLFEFDENSGSNPMGSMVLANNGILYGTTPQNGTNHTSGGAIFSFDPSTNVQKRLYGFENGGDGVFPNGTMVLAPDGKLYGMTQVGGTGQNFYGVLFSYDILNSVFTKEQDFNNLNGAYPGVSSALMVYNSGQQNIPPKIQITEPLNNKQYDAGTSIAFKANAVDTDGSISKVEFYLGKVKVGEDNSPPFEIIKKGLEPGSYQLAAVATDNSSAKTSSDTVRFFVTACKPKGNISVEWFKNIPGSTINELVVSPAYPDRPDKISLISNFEYSDQGDRYGARVRGYICAPQSGNYIFYISGDDEGQLFLSSDENPVNKVMIAKADKNKNHNGWFKSVGQKSMPVSLVKGGRYYIETLHKQNRGANHLAVAWKLPSGVFEAPIARNRLSPFLKVKSSSENHEAFGDVMLQETEVVNLPFEIRISPNPTTQYFTLAIKSGSNEVLSYLISDLSGRIIEQGKNLMPNTTKELGRSLIPGVYILQVVQGKERRLIKLVKQ